MSLCLKSVDEVEVDFAVSLLELSMDVCWGAKQKAAKRETGVAVVDGLYSATASHAA